VIDSDRTKIVWNRTATARNFSKLPLVATDRGQTFLTWRCGELTYRLSGPTETERLVELAEEIGCSAAASDRRVNQTRV